MIPILLKLLEFRSNNKIHRPVIEALELLKKYTDSRERYYDESETVPLDGIVKNNWSDIILETNPEGKSKINRINYGTFRLNLDERLPLHKIRLHPWSESV